MKNIFKVIILVVVFCIVVDVLELIFEALPGTPNYNLQRQLSSLRDADIYQWLQWLVGKDGKSVTEGAAAITCLVILPLTGLVTGLVGSLLVMTRKKVIALVSITYLCVVALSYLATFALYEMLETIRCVGVRTPACYRPTSFLVVVLPITGLGLSCFTAWLGHLLGDSRRAVVDS